MPCQAEGSDATDHTKEIKTPHGLWLRAYVPQKGLVVITSRHTIPAEKRAEFAILAQIAGKDPGPAFCESEVYRATGVENGQIDWRTALATQTYPKRTPIKGLRERHSEMIAAVAAGILDSAVPAV